MSKDYVSKMPRNRKRKTEIGMHTEHAMQDAINLICEGVKIRDAARRKGIPFTTVYRYYKKYQNSPHENIRLTPNYAVNKIFSDAMEQSLVDYIIKCAEMFYGLTPNDVRNLAYEMAVINNLKVPDKWHLYEKAGIEWLYNFRKRHPELSLRTPEGCSLSRATSFNRHNVNVFFDNLQTAMSRHECFGNGMRVYNLDETNTVTVQKSGKILAPRGQKQVSKVTSGEKGILVTTCCIINAAGYALSPVMIFPRVHFKNHMLAGAPPGTLGLATPSGWMNSDLFVETMKHFIKHTQSSKENPSLLIMDNYEAHICLRALNLAKENGVTVLTVPPHSTARLQPLDVAVYSPFKKAYNAAVDSWMMRNPGKTFSIYEVAACVREAHMKAITPSNICSAFEATGIFPYNRDIFSDTDFAPSELTDRPLENTTPENLWPEIDFDGVVTRTPSPSLLLDDNIFEPPRTPPSILQPISDSTMSAHDTDIAGSSSIPSRQAVDTEALPMNSESLQVTPDSPGPSLITNRPQVIEQEAVSATTQSRQVTDVSSNNNCSNLNYSSIPSSSGIFNSKLAQKKSFLSPFNIRGLPKAAPRHSGRAPRRKGKSMIATDTPNKAEIEERELNKLRKKMKNTTKTVKKKILQSESSEEDDRMSLYSEDEGGFEDEETEDNLTIDPKRFRPLTAFPKEGNFCLVQFAQKNKLIFYVAKVLKEAVRNEVDVSYLRKCCKNLNTFRLPNVPDLATVHLSDIKLLMSQPSFTGQTKRQQGFYKFAYDFSQIDIR